MRSTTVVDRRPVNVAAAVIFAPFASARPVEALDAHPRAAARQHGALASARAGDDDTGTARRLHVVGDDADRAPAREVADRRVDDRPRRTARAGGRAGQRRAAIRRPPPDPIPRPARARGAQSPHAPPERCRETITPSPARAKTYASPDATYTAAGLSSKTSARATPHDAVKQRSTSSSHKRALARGRHPDRKGLLDVRLRGQGGARGDANQLVRRDRLAEEEALAERQPSARSASACSGSSMPSGTSTRPSDSPMATIARSSALSSSARRR